MNTYTVTFIPGFESKIFPEKPQTVVAAVLSVENGFISFWDSTAPARNLVAAFNAAEVLAVTVQVNATK